MKRIRGFSIVLFLALIAASCNNDPCIVGNWTWENSYFICPSKVTINGNNTGTIVVNDCAGNCPTGTTDATTRYNFTWSLVSDTVFTVSFASQGLRCGNAYTFVGGEALGDITGVAKCTGDSIIYTHPNGIWEFKIQ